MGLRKVELTQVIIQALMEPHLLQEYDETLPKIDRALSGH
jgi:hypothetical protein